jgi:GT2 family glycosyltransferase
MSDSDKANGKVMPQLDEPLTSIIIPNYNGEHHLSECLSSLLEQTYKELEIIVVDNASADGSVELVRREYPGVRLVSLDANRGFSAAVNAGINISRGELVVILNNDTRTEPEFVKELCSALAEEPDASMAAPKMLFARGPETINSMGLGYCITGTNHDIGFGLEDGPQFEKSDWIFGPCGGAGIYRRGVFDEAGLFDEDFFMYYEDVDHSFRAQLAGHKCIFVPKARVYHTEGASTGALPKSKNYYFSRNSFAVILKNFPAGLLLRYFHVLLWEMAKRVCSPMLRGDVSALLGYLSTFGQIGGIIRKRREVQRRRRVAIDYIENILKKNRSVLKQINLRGRPAEELQ